MEILIRPWQKEDIPAVRRILWESWLATYRAFIPEKDLEAYFAATYQPDALLRLYETPFVHGLIGEADGEAVGFARTQYHENENRLYLASLYLRPGFQGLGVGGCLLRAAEERARAYRLSDIWVGVMVKNEAAGRWYERQGFVFIREEPFRMAGTTVAHRIGYMRIARPGRDADLQRRIQAVYPGDPAGGTLADLAASLCAEQQKTWPAFGSGCASLAKVRVREIRGRGWRVNVQFNPQRLASSGAPVDPESIGRRPCFLCRKHLPPEQRAILYQDDYLILANPMPLFPNHLTIAHLRHLPQSLVEHLEHFLLLAADFGPRMVVFYNGPRCGASAPDHLHFQAAPAGLLPVEAAVAGPRHRCLIERAGGVSLWRTRGLGRGILVIEGEEAAPLRASVERILEALRRFDSDGPDEEEPLLNLLATHRGDRWRLILFPRRKHRPAAYFREGEERLLISPGAADMAGLIVTPREQDFLALDRERVAALYEEVAFDDAALESLLESR